jgi:hypothetical protein
MGKSLQVVRDVAYILALCFWRTLLVVGVTNHLFMLPSLLHILILIFAFLGA